MGCAEIGKVDFLYIKQGKVIPYLLSFSGKMVTKDGGKMWKDAGMVKKVEKRGMIEIFHSFSEGGEC